MMAVIPILNLLKLPQLWRYVGFMSSVIGLVCYASSSSFQHLFGEWNLWKIILYGVGSFIICTFMLFAKKWQLSCSLMLKAHVGFLVLMVTSVYSFFYDKAVKGKADVLGLVSCGSFAFMSFSLSRQMDLGFEVDLLNFFLGCLTVQLMKINLILASVGAVFCYFLILLRSSLDSHVQQIGTVSITDHVAVQVDAENGLEKASESDHGSNSGFISGDSNHQQNSPPLRRREKFVDSLIASDASGGAVTDPCAQDPIGKTAASIATSSGLSRSSAEFEEDLKVGSEDQLSLKDTLAAVRNANQAAARIQLAFLRGRKRKMENKME